MIVSSYERNNSNYMSKKKVEVFKVKIRTVDDSILSLGDLLLVPSLINKVVRTGGKHIQLDYVEDKGDYIVGLVKSTNMSSTPPKNNVATGVMAPLGLGGAEGLCYGNVFLYSKKNNFFLYEVSKNGVYAGQLANLMYDLVRDEPIQEFDIQFRVVLTVDALKKLLTMGGQKAIHMQFVDPADIVRKVKNKQKSLKEIAKSGDELGAELIDVVYKITSRQGRTLNSGRINQLVTWISDNFGLVKDNIKEISVKGYEEDQETLTEVDLIRDRMVEFISYTENKNMDDLRPVPRKQEIVAAYERITKDLKKIAANELG